MRHCGRAGPLHAVFRVVNLQVESAISVQKLKPTIDAIKRQYGEDKDKIQRETSALYEKAGVNPLAGTPLAFSPLIPLRSQNFTHSIMATCQSFAGIENSNVILCMPDKSIQIASAVGLIGEYQKMSCRLRTHPGDHPRLLGPLPHTQQCGRPGSAHRGVLLDPQPLRAHYHRTTESRHVPHPLIPVWLPHH